MWLKRFFCLCGSVYFLFCVQVYAGAVKGSGDVLTRGEALEILLDAADVYTPGLTAGDILKGNGGAGLCEDLPLTWSEAIVMLERAFGIIGDSGSHYGRISGSGEEVPVSDFPEWALEGVEKLNRAGILISTDRGFSEPDAHITEFELMTLLRRVWYIKGGYLKDDFYAAVNKKRLDSYELPPGRASNGELDRFNSNVASRLDEILYETLSSPQETGSGGRKTSDFYKCALDMNSRNSEGAEPLAEYLSAIEGISSMEDFERVYAEILKETGVSLLIGFEVERDFRDGSKNAMYIMADSPPLPKAFFKDEDPVLKEAYVYFLESLFKLSGDDEVESQQNAAAVYSMQRLISEKCLEPENYSDFTKAFLEYPASELYRDFHISLPKLISCAGYTLPDTLTVADPGLIEAYAILFKPENLEAIKAHAKFTLLFTFRHCLSEDFLRASGEFERAYYGIKGEISAEKYAFSDTVKHMSPYLEREYVSRYLPESAKDYIGDMIGDIIEVYKKRIEALEWMGAESKESALAKLNALNYTVGYDEDSVNSLEDAVIKGPAEGGSYFKNLCQLHLAALRESVKKQNAPPDEKKWYYPSYTVNAYYSPHFNRITILAGILQAPVFDINAPYEDNLGGIGFVIAHEISHCFDAAGSMFNENGELVNWWTEEDFKHFSELCAKTEAYYEGFEYAPGISCNGKLTLNENIADLGAMSCVLELASGLKNPDYAALFINFAVCWSQTATRENYLLQSCTDPHCASSLRVNCTLQSFGTFYSVFGIEPGDGMYTEPEERPSVW